MNGEVAGDDQEDQRVMDQLVEAFSSASL
uniref:Uncharacterized protein n=1 Tax=Nelumbo nucifera TaxID=4432 RepID=A0A822ZNY3_NELNU|nr:TPA_asm: hypothetical protein HUJ06_001728 [Nelumbo nucifera]